MVLQSRILMAILLICWVAGTPGWAGSGDRPKGGPPPAKVRLGIVGTQMLGARSRVVGQLRAARRATVAAERSGRVVQAAIEEGDPVVEGESELVQIDDVLPRLDLAWARAQLAEAEARTLASKVTLDLAVRHRDYLKTLEGGGSTVPKEVEDASDAARVAAARVKAAKASVQAAQMRVASAEEAVERLKVLAPFDGVVVRKLTEVGQWLEEGAPVAEVISRGQIDAVIDVPERLINRVNLRDAVEIMIEPLDVAVEASVVSITPLGSPAARTFPVKARLDDQNGRFKVGMSVIAEVPNGKRRQLLTVPRAAVRQTPNGATVWADLGGVAALVPIRVMFGHGLSYAVEAISTGNGPVLRSKMKVVVEGAERLFPGRPLVEIPQESRAESQDRPASDSGYSPSDS